MKSKMSARLISGIPTMVALLVLGGLVSTGVMAKNTNPLSVEDRLAIEDVLERYSIALNNNDWDALGQVFTEDSVQEWSESSEGAMSARMVGRKAIVNMVSSLPQYKAGTNDHLNVNSVIWRDGTGTVRAWSYYVVPMPDKTVRAGEYLDVFVNTEDGWRISYRRGNRRSAYGAQSKEWYGPWWLSSAGAK